MAVSYFNLMLTTDHPVAIQPGGGTATVTNAAGSASLYYGSDPGVSSANNQGTIAAGGSQAFTQQTWIRSAGLSSVTIAIDSSPPSAGGGAMTLLSAITLAAPGTFDVTGIPATYNDLVLAGMFRGSVSAATEELRMRFNNDSGSHYGSVYMQNATASPSGAQQNTQTAASLAITVPGATGAANSFGLVTCSIIGYASTAWMKSFRSESALGLDITTGNMGVYEQTGFWNQTAAINEIQIYGIGAANLVAGSQLRVYGRT